MCTYRPSMNAHSSSMNLKLELKYMIAKDSELSNNSKNTFQLTRHRAKTNYNGIAKSAKINTFSKICKKSST